MTWRLHASCRISIPESHETHTLRATQSCQGCSLNALPEVGATRGASFATCFAAPAALGVSGRQLDTPSHPCPHLPPPTPPSPLPHPPTHHRQQVKRFLRDEIEQGKWERSTVTWIPGATPELILFDAEDKEVRSGGCRLAVAIRRLRSRPGPAPPPAACARARGGQARTPRGASSAGRAGLRPRPDPDKPETQPPPSPASQIERIGLRDKNNFDTLVALMGAKGFSRAQEGGNAGVVEEEELSHGGRELKQLARPAGA